MALDRETSLQTTEKAGNGMRVRWLVALLALFAVIRLVTLNAYPLLDPTEGRYAEIPREMIAANDWVVPRLRTDTPFWGKPPLQFWATILSYTLLGENEFSARLPSFCFSMLALALAFWMSLRSWGREVAVSTAVILVTSGLFYVYAGTVTIDPSLLATTTLGLVAFVNFVEANQSKSRRLWGYIYFVALGVSPLAKGLVGPVLILAPVVTWTLSKRDRRCFLSALPWKSGLCLTFLIAAPWHVLCEWRSPGFLNYYFIGEHFKRFLIPDWSGDLYGNPHAFPMGTIWLFLMAASFPWIILTAALLYWMTRRKQKLSLLLSDFPQSFLLHWFLTPLLFFTFSRNITISYVLPSLPPLAALLAKSLTDLRSRHEVGGQPWFLVRRTIPLLSLLVPIIITLLSYSFIPRVAVHKSQKELVDTFQRLDVAKNSELVYLDRMYWSGDFYSSGKAIFIPRGDTRTLQNELNDSVQDYYVIQPDHLSDVGPEFLVKTENVGKFGRVVLRREPHGKDIPPGIIR